MKHYQKVLIWLGLLLVSWAAVILMGIGIYHGSKVIWP